MANNIEILEEDERFPKFLGHLGPKHRDRAHAALAMLKILGSRIEDNPDLSLNYEFDRDWDYGFNIVVITIKCLSCDFDSAMDLWNGLTNKAYQTVKDVLELKKAKLIRLMRYTSIRFEWGEDNE